MQTDDDSQTAQTLDQISIKWYWLVFGLICFVLLYFLAPILTPFLIAAILAYLGDPLVDRLEKAKLSRTISVVIVFLSIFIVLLLLFLFLVPMLETQTRRLITQFPNYIDWFMGLAGPFLQNTFGIDLNVLEVDRKNLVASNWKDTGGFIRNTVQTLSKSGAVVVGLVANLTLIPVLTFYLLRDWDDLITAIDDLLPRSIEPKVAQIAKEADETLSAFLRGQLLVMLALSIMYATGLTFVGLDSALLIGLMAGIVSFVPYLGLILGIAVAGIAILFQTQDPLALLWVVLVFSAAQMVEGMILTPMFVGERVGLHPVAVIFAVMAGGTLFGFFGVLLALPVASVLAVILRHLRHSYKQSQLYQDSTYPPPGEPRIITSEFTE